MMKKIIVTSICLFCVFQNAASQQLSLEQLVKKAYYKADLTGIDSMAYIISDCCKFIDASTTSASNVKIKTFKNKKSLESVMTEANLFLLNVSLIRIYPKKIHLILTISVVNKQLYNRDPQFMVFYDEREVECTRDAKGEWIYSKTLSKKSHLTDQ